MLNLFSAVHFTEQAIGNTWSSLWTHILVTGLSADSCWFSLIVALCICSLFSFLCLALDNVRGPSVLLCLTSQVITLSIYAEPAMRLRNTSMDGPGGSQLFEDTSGAAAGTHAGYVRAGHATYYSTDCCYKNCLLHKIIGPSVAENFSIIQH